MKNDGAKPVSRREFLSRLGRGAIMAALGLAGFRAIRDAARESQADGPESFPDRQECVSNGVCPACLASKGCGTPQALAWKEGRTL